MPPRRKPCSLETARALLLALPGVEEGTSYRTPAWRVRKKLLARIQEDGETLVLKVDPDARDALLAADPKIYFVTPHYDGYPMVLVRLPRIGEAALADLLEEAWRGLASARQIAELEGRAS